MKIPVDCPKWVESMLESAEQFMETSIAGAKTSDDALKASGAYGLWKRVKEEVELEASRQEEFIRKRNISLNARDTN